MWINDTTGKVLPTHSDIRMDAVNVSFPQVMTDEMLIEFGYLPVQLVTPVFNTATQSAIEIAPLKVGQVWIQQWEISDLDAEGLAAVFDRAVEAFDVALTAHLDATAKSRRYDNRVTCALRAGYIGPFQAEGQAFATWMDTCNALAYETLGAVKDGTKPMPDSPQAFISTLPLMVWP